MKTSLSLMLRTLYLWLRNQGSSDLREVSAWPFPISSWNCKSVILS